MPIKTDHLLEHLGRENWHPAGLFLKNDLQENAAGQVLIGFGIENLKTLGRHHQLFNVSEGYIGTRLGIVKTPIGILFNQALVANPFCSCSHGYSFARCCNAEFTQV